ncbi:hypothetical protein M8C21_014589, partial [Ambrosia artemisiifolia]
VYYWREAMQVHGCMTDRSIDVSKVTALTSIPSNHANTGLQCSPEKGGAVYSKLQELANNNMDSN